MEFAFPDTSYAAAAYTTGVDSSASSGYSINRYWSMWKLPMYGATDADQVLAECKKCAKAFPGAFVRLCGFDSTRQARPRPPGTFLAAHIQPEFRVLTRSPLASAPPGAGGGLHHAAPGWRRRPAGERPRRPGLSVSPEPVLRTRTRAGCPTFRAVRAARRAQSLCFALVTHRACYHS